MRKTRALPKMLIVAACLVAAAAPAAAQIPDEYKNLQVLPREIKKVDLVAQMRAIAGALGVRCSHCHVGGNPETLEGVDFASDDKAAKKVARAMMRMVQEINGSHLARIETGRAERTSVKCATCHHGLTVPRAIEDVLSATMGAKGVDAAIAEYRELREKNYGSYAYDFGDRPLNLVGEGLLRAGKHDDAIALLRLNTEVNPKATYPRILLARALEAKKDKPAAIEELKKVLEIEPGNRFVQKMLADLTGAP